MIEQLPLTYSGGSFLTSTRRAVWHTTEGGSVDGAISAYRSQGFCPHFTWDPDTGHILQHLPLDIAATTLVHTGDPQTNRWGAIQTEVKGFAAHPFTDGPCVGLGELVGILRAQAIPDVWPMGAPKPYPSSYGLHNGSRDPAVWLAQPGHYTHSQVPGNEHGDPGAIDITRILKAGTTPTPPPIPTIISEVDVFLVQEKGSKTVHAIGAGPNGVTAVTAANLPAWAAAITNATGKPAVIQPVEAGFIDNIKTGH